MQLNLLQSNAKMGNCQTCFCIAIKWNRGLWYLKQVHTNLVSLLKGLSLNHSSYWTNGRNGANIFKEKHFWNIKISLLTEVMRQHLRRVSFSIRLKMLVILKACLLQMHGDTITQPSFIQHPSADPTEGTGITGPEPPYWLQTLFHPAPLQTQLDRYWYWGWLSEILPTAAVSTRSGHPSHPPGENWRE